MVTENSKIAWECLQEMLPAETLGNFMQLVSRDQKELLNKNYKENDLPKDIVEIMDLAFDAALEEYRAK